MKKDKFQIIFVSLLCCLFFSLTAFANSAPIHITSGDPSRGVIPMEESPLIVEKELLTFDIQHLLPEEKDYDIEGAADRSGTVCAQYYFKNPSSEAVSLRLAFAHGIERVNSSCSVRINGQPLETQIRYTYTDGMTDFYGPDDAKKITDVFSEDVFFCPKMPVTEYSFSFDGLSDDGYTEALFEYAIPEGTAARIIVPCGKSAGGAYTRNVKNGGSISVFVIGDSEGVETAWDIGGSRRILPEAGRKMTLSEFASLTMKEIPDISETDSYNAVVEEMNAAEDSDLILSYMPEKRPDTTMWTEYEFTIGPGETAVNEVKAVLAPEIFNYRKNPEYDYYYLLSPAQCWKEFGSLDVTINTPHKFYKYEEEGYEKTETGYIKHFETLPEGELHFCLTEGKTSSSGSSKSGGNGGALVGTLVAVLIFIVAAVFGIGIITVIVIIIVNSRKRKKK